MTVAFHPAGKELAIYCKGAIHLFDPASGRPLRQLFAAGDSWSQLSYSGDGKWRALMTSSQVLLWDARTGKRVPTRGWPAGHPREVAFPPSGNPVGFGRLYSPRVFLWDLLGGRPLSPFDAHDAAIAGLVFPGPGRLLTGGRDGRAIEWDLAGRQRKPSSYSEGPTGEQWSLLGMESISFSPRGRYTVRGMDQGALLCERDTGAAVLRRQWYSPDQYCHIETAFSRDESVVVMAAWMLHRKPTALLPMRADSGEALPAIQLPAGYLAALAVSPDGRLVAAMTGRERFIERRDLPCAVGVYETATGKPLVGFRWKERAGGAGRALEFSPDGRLLLVQPAGPELLLLDARTGKQRLAIRAASASLRQACFSPDGRTLAVVERHESRPDEIGVYEVSTGRQRLRLAPRAKVTALKFSTFRRVLASGHADGTALLWDLMPRPPIVKATGPLAALGGSDAAAAYRAMGQLRRDPARAIALVRKHVKPGPTPDATLVKRLIVALDSEEAPERERAQKALHRLGHDVEQDLRQALENGPSLEARWRMQRLLAGLSGPYPSEVILPLRAIELLEMIGTAEAKSVLGELAGGTARSVVTQEAKQALARLTRPGAPGR
jgi:WD40 repeat protein